MAKQLVVEIGARLARVCVCSTKRSSLLDIEKSFFFSTPDECFADGMVVQPDVLASALLEQMSLNGVSGVNEVTFVVASPKIVMRTVTIPPVKKRLVGGIIAANATEYFPIDLTSYVVNHRIVEEIKGETPGYRVLVTATPKQVLSGYEKLAENARLNLVDIDHNANSQYQLFRRLKTTGNTLFLNVGTRQTLATFMSDSVLVAQRTIPAGGDEVINAVMQINGLEEDSVSEAIRLSCDREWVKQNLPPERFELIVSRLISGIDRAADFVKSSSKIDEIDSIVLCGNCAEIAYLREAISRGMHAEAINISKLPELHKVVTGEKLSFFIGCAAGLIEPLELLDKTSAKYKNAVTSSGNARSGIGIGIATLVVCIVASVGFSGYAAFNYFSAEAELASLNAQIEQLRPVEEVYNVYVAYNSAKENIEILNGYSTNHNAGIPAFLEELEDKMPSSLLLLSASCDNFGVNMMINTATMADAAVVLSELRKFETIQQLTVSAIAEETNELGVTTTAFSVTCLYDLPEEPAALEEVPLEEGEALLEDEELLT